MPESDKNQKEELKKELEKKKKEFKSVKEKAKKQEEREKHKITKEKEEKLEKTSKKLNKFLRRLFRRKEGVLEELEKRERKLHKQYEKRHKYALEEHMKKHKRIYKEADKANKEVEEETEKMIKEGRKDLIRIERRVYSTRRKVINTIQFVIVIYLFILSIDLIKDVAEALGSGTISMITDTVDTFPSAFGAGWLGSIIVQSASIIAIVVNSIVGSGIITFDTAFYMLVGLSLGNAITPILASLVISTKKHWDLRHGFELGVANVIYSFFLAIVVIAIEYFTSFFTNTGLSIGSWVETSGITANIPSVLDIITGPIKGIIYNFEFSILINFVIGIILLIFSLQRVGKSMLVFLGGRRHTRAIMEKHLSTSWRAFFIGLALTIIVPSSSILVTLMVPLAIARIITLRQAIPFMIGTNAGTFIDVLLAAFANAEPLAVAGGIILTLISLFGLIFIFRNWGVMLIYKITRFLTLRVIPMRKRNIVKFLGVFVIIPFLILVIF